MSVSVIVDLEGLLYGLGGKYHYMCLGVSEDFVGDSLHLDVLFHAELHRQDGWAAVCSSCPLQQ